MKGVPGHVGVAGAGGAGVRLLCEIQQIISVVNYFNVIDIEFSNCFTLLIDAMKSLEF